jgi:hypothetical protein
MLAAQLVRSARSSKDRQAGMQKEDRRDDDENQSVGDAKTESRIFRHGFANTIGVLLIDPRIVPACPCPMPRRQEPSASDSGTGATNALPAPL